MCLKSLYFCIYLSSFNIILSNNNLIDIGVESVKSLGSGEYLIDIYAKNSLPIAGIQFDILGENFEDTNANKKWDIGENFEDANENGKYDSELFDMLDVTGGRAEKNGLEFHTGKDKGVILAFSMKGNTIAPTKDLESLTLFTIKVKKKSTLPLSFNVRPIIAGQRGVKLESRFIPTVIK